MDAFTLIVVVSFVALILAVLALGLWHPRTGAQILDWKPTRSPELEYQNEIDDTEQMLAAQNAMRARRGLAPRTEEEVEEEVRRHKREMDDFAQAYWADQRKQGIRPTKEDL